MKAQQSYLGPKFKSTVLSGGDQLTCECQRCSQKHVMDSDNRRDRLELLEPQVEDQHALQSIELGIWSYANARLFIIMTVYNTTITNPICRLHGSVY